MSQSPTARMINATLAGHILAQTTTEDPLARFVRPAEPYDYKGAILYVFGLLIMYGISIFLLIISLIRKARSEFEVIDYIRDLDEMRRDTRRKNRAPERSKLSSLKSFAGFGSKSKLNESVPSLTEAFRQYSRPLLIGASTSERHTTIRPFSPPEIQVKSEAYRARRSSIAVPGMARLVAPVNLGVRRKSDGMVMGLKSPILPERRGSILPDRRGSRLGLDLKLPDSMTFMSEANEASAMLQSPNPLLVSSPTCSYGTLESERVDRRPPVHVSLPSPVSTPEFPGVQILYDPMEDRERYRLRPKHERALGMPLYDPSTRRPSAFAHEAYTAGGMGPRLAMVRQDIRRNSALARFGLNYTTVEEVPEVDSRSVSPAVPYEEEEDDDLMMPADSDCASTATTDSDEILPAITKVWVPGVSKDPIALHIE